MSRRSIVLFKSQDLVLKAKSQRDRGQRPCLDPARNRMGREPLIPEQGLTMTEDQQRRVASEVEQSHPRWIVMWGAYSHMFWAFPRFDVPKGTIVSAPDPGRLTADMQRVEDEARVGLPVPAYQAPTLTAPLPKRHPHTGPAPGQVQRGAFPVPAARTGAVGWMAQTARMRHDPYVGGPDQPDPYGFDGDEPYRHGFDADYSDPHDYPASPES
jgi:hypothetical protein